MATPRYLMMDAWFKGNTHIHSTASDGGWSFQQLADGYAGAGYHFLVRTDHWVPSAASGADGGNPLLWLDGIELDGFDDLGSFYHVVALGHFEGIQREMGFPAALAAVREQAGLLILAHPFWTGNAFEEARRWGFQGVEIYNHVCHWLNGKGDGLAYWHAMLANAPGTLGFACDDAHIRPEHPGWNGGWVMVQAAELSAKALMEGLRAGRFYSSTGPVFERIACDGERVTVVTSPVRFIRLVGPTSHGMRMGSFEDSLLCEATFDLPSDWPYAYVEIEDIGGRRAWTNTLMVPSG